MQNFEKIFLVILFSFLQNNYLKAQTLTQIEGEFVNKKLLAIEELKKYPKGDTLRVNALLKICTYTYFYKQRKEIFPYCEEAIALSRKLNYSKGLVICYNWLGEFYKGSNNYTKALVFFDSTINLSTNISFTLHGYYKGLAYYRRGCIFEELENYHSSLKNYFEALNYFEAFKYLKNKNNELENVFPHISKVYKTLNNYDKALEYEFKYLDICRNDPEKEKIADGYLNVSNIYLIKKDTKNGILYLDSFKIYIDQIDPYFLVSYYETFAELQYQKKQYDSAYYYNRLCLLYDEEHGHNFQTKNTLYNLSSLALKLGKLDEAKKYAERNLKLVSNVNSRHGTSGALENLAEYNNRIGNNAKAYELLYQSMLLKDSIYSEENLKQNNTLAAIYETDKKQNEIAQLQIDKKMQDASLKHKSTTNKILIGATIGLSILGFLGYRNFKAKRKLQQAKIIELEKDKQLLAIDAILLGQEKERSRIAKDLHDGLGGMLSGVKLNFVNMKENLIMDKKNVELFENSILQLDNTIAELRKVAHNLMPEALVKFGLKNAILDYCNTLQISSKVKIIYEQMGMEREFGNTTDAYIYRIIQELVNNAVKHANASQILIQLTKNLTNVLITVEDNGKGVDKITILTATGIGMKSVQQRVDYLKGTIEIDSKPNEGVSFHIELQV